jgi:mitotic spindle assembly checkpoint protein MAD1
MARANQPTWDFITGGEPSPQLRQPLREVSKQPTTASRSDINTEEIRAQLRATQYELDSLKQERELHELQQQRELRDLQTRAENDFRRAQVADAASEAAKRKLDALVREVQEVRDRAENEKLAFERKTRDLKDDAQTLREELEEANSMLASHERQTKHTSQELEQRHAALQASVEDIQQDLNGKVLALQTAQQKLKSCEQERGLLENEVLRLKAQTGDSETLAVIKKELTEQVTYIRKIEVINREQGAEIKSLRKQQKSVDVLEEEKRALETKLSLMDNLRKELNEAQLQRRILQDEKLEWTSFLEAQASNNGEFEFKTPEQMARALMQERLERLDLVDKIGIMQPELSAKDETIQSLQSEKDELRMEMAKLKEGSAVASAGSSGDSKARLRLERQKNLLQKEAEYLRAQLKNQEAEDAEFTPGQIDEKQAQRMAELESMVENYQKEVQALQADLAKLEADPAPPAAHAKRGRSDDDVNDDERLGEMRRKCRTLQDEIEALQNRNKVLKAEAKASASQIKALKESSKTRVLELRNNPTAEAETVKLSAIRTLREENAALLAQMEGRADSTLRVVPVSTLENIREQMAEGEAQRVQNEKKTMRLKQIWSAKSLEFREAVCSILGWRLDFMPNGRVQATSELYPTSYCDGEQQQNSIIFDGEKGTMKISGGPQSLFAKEIKSLIEFWVDGRKEIPCFLAACTLEFYDRSTRAQNM